MICPKCQFGYEPTTTAADCPHCRNGLNPLYAEIDRLRDECNRLVARVNQLEVDASILDALKKCGVEHWEGYSRAMATFLEEMAEPGYTPERIQW